MAGRTEHNLSPKTRRRAVREQKQTSGHNRPTAEDRNHMPLTARLIVVALIVGLIGAGVFFLGRHFNGAWAARDAVSAAISKVEDADDAIVELNEVVSSTVDEADTEKANELTKAANKAVELLGQADNSLARASALDEFLNENELAICDALRTSIDARRTMIGAGEAIISVDAMVGTARDELNQAVDKALEADEKSREATTKANEYAKYLTGDESVATKDATSVVELDNEVIALINEAKEHVASAKKTFSEPDYGAYETYLEKRGEAAQAMLDADTALVSGDFTSASELTAKYNEADTAATQAAATLPATTSEIFTEPYASLTDGQRTTYSEAAKKAADADILIRHYQGINVSSSALSDNTAAATTEQDAETAKAQTAETAAPVIVED